MDVSCGGADLRQTADLKNSPQGRFSTSSSALRRRPSTLRPRAQALCALAPEPLRSRVKQRRARWRARASGDAGLTTTDQAQDGLDQPRPQASRSPLRRPCMAGRSSAACAPREIQTRALPCAWRRALGALSAALRLGSCAGRHGLGSGHGVHRVVVARPAALPRRERVRAGVTGRFKPRTQALDTRHSTPCAAAIRTAPWLCPEIPMAQPKAVRVSTCARAGFKRAGSLPKSHRPGEGPAPPRTLSVHPDSP